MILRTSIYNHNYYPIKLYNLKQQILYTDNETVHPSFNVYDTTFDDDLGLMIKPFQDAEYITVIEPNVDKFDGDIVFEQIFGTDSYDYSAFGNLSNWHYNLNKRAVIVKLDDESRLISPMAESITDYNAQEFIDIEFNMKGVSDQKELYDYLKKFNLHNFEIEDVDFYGDGVLSAFYMEKVPIECGIHGIFRGGVVGLLDGSTLGTSDLITMAENGDGTYKVQIDTKEEDVQCKLRIRGSVLEVITQNVSQHFMEWLKQMKYDPMLVPVYQWPIGMSVVLNLTPNHQKPFKLNLKIYTNINFAIDTGFTIGGAGIDSGTPVEIKEYLTLLFDPSMNRNSLMASPPRMHIYSHPSDFYTGQVQVFSYPFKNHEQEGSQEETEMVINTIDWKNNDQEVINANVSLSHDTLPSIKVIPQNERYLDRNPFNLFVDTTGLMVDYENSIIVGFDYNGESRTKEIPINVWPNLELSQNLIINNAFFGNSGIKPSGYALPQQKEPVYPKLNINIGHSNQDDILTITLNNEGNSNAKISKIELIDIDDYEEAFKGHETALADIKRYIVGGNNADVLMFAYSILPEGDYDKNEEYDPKDLVDQGKLTDYISYKTISITNEDINLNNLQPIVIKIQINRLKATQNQVVGKCAVLKVTYNNGQICYSGEYKNSIRILNTQTSVGYEKCKDITYIKPRSRSTLFLKLFKTVSNSVYVQDDFGNEAAITDVKVLNYDDNQETYITDDEVLIEKSKLPFGILTGTKRTVFQFDVELSEERIYQFKLRLYTNVPNIPFVDVPYEIICTALDPEQAIKFDESDFYVRNNKYFLSLNRNVPKQRNIAIKNTTSTDIIVNDITFDLPTSQLGMTDILAEQLNNITLPYKLTNKNPIKLQFDFQGRTYGRGTGFIILETDLGMVYLPLVIFVNTKLKDVMVLMENVRGVEFTAPLNSVDREFIKLINFGDDLSLVDVTKLGYDKNEFLVESNPILFPNSENYIETMFTPTSTGKKIGYVDLKIKDMLETFVLRDTDQSKVFKIQNTHIIAEMMGTAMADHALPQFSKSVVDFGYIAANLKDRTMRYDTFEIKNLGLTPFIITGISKIDPDSPFLIPLAGQNLPIKVDRAITLPVWLNNKKLNDTQKVYTDLFKFEMQDLKSKRTYTYDIIVKIELTDAKREYFSFNSEYIQFGYCQINHFKTDEITVKNYSTGKVVLNIDTSGANELQSVENMTINLWPSQSFDIPIYFYPHGIDTFKSKLVLDFDEGNYIKEIDLFGLGVDFNSPLVHVENKLAEYYKTLVDHLGRPKYI